MNNELKWITVDNLRMEHKIYKPKQVPEDKLELDHIEYGITTINVSKISTITAYKDEYAINLDDGQVIMINEETYMELMQIFGIAEEEPENA